jgi:hypothetical protein
MDDPSSKRDESDVARSVASRYGFDPHALKAMQEFALQNQRLVDQALRSFDALMPNALQQAQFAAAAELARTLTGLSALTGLREAMRAQGEVQRVLASAAMSRYGELKGIDVAKAHADRLTGLSAAIKLVQELPSSTVIAQASAVSRRVERLNTATMTSWRRVVVQPPGAVLNLVRLEAAGRTTYGLGKRLRANHPRHNHTGSSRQGVACCAR